MRIVEFGRTALVLALVAATGVAFAQQKTRIVSEDAEKEWKVSGENPPTPAYPSVASNKSDQVCVSIGYYLQADGTTANHAILKSWSAANPQLEGEELDKYVDPFARNALAALSAWRFAPVKEGASPRAIYTATTFAFSNDPAADRGAIRGHCVIGNLPAFIAKAQADAYKRGNMQKGEYDRRRQDYKQIDWDRN